MLGNLPMGVLGNDKEEVVQVAGRPNSFVIAGASESCKSPDPKGRRALCVLASVIEEQRIEDEESIHSNPSSCEDEGEIEIEVVTDDELLDFRGEMLEINSPRSFQSL